MAGRAPFRSAVCSIDLRQNDLRIALRKPILILRQEEPAGRHTSEHPKGGRDGAEWRRFTTATSIKISEIFPLVLTSSRPRLSGSNVGRDPIKMRASCICSIYSRGAGKRKTDAHRHASSTRWSARTVDDDELGSLFLLPRSHTKNGGSTPLWHQSKQREGNNCRRIEIS